MSLLIKALDKAEKAQAANSDNLTSSAEAPALTLEPTSEANKPVFSRVAQHQQQSKAANVFQAKTTAEPNNGLWLGLVGLGLLAGLGLYYYIQLNQFNQPNNPIQNVQAANATAPIAQSGPSAPLLNDSEMAKNELASNEIAPKPEIATADNAETKVNTVTAAQADLPSNRRKKIADSADLVGSANSQQPNEQDVLVIAQAEKSAARKNSLVFKRTAKTGLGEPVVIASPSVSVTKSANKREAQGQTLLRAYQAFQQGDEAVAQVLYQQVLNKEPYNIDAMLGLGVIAQRQQKMDEAEIWFAKVLKLEPQNAIANAALQAEAPMNVPNVELGLAENAESQLKSQLINAPNDAHLHTRLGHFYADQNRWSDAQAAFFEAYRINSNQADYAYNLAVSLDQLGKANLAAGYYQQALRLIESGATAAVTAETISNRLHTIQQ